MFCYYVALKNIIGRYEEMTWVLGKKKSWYRFSISWAGRVTGVSYPIIRSTLEMDSCGLSGLARQQIQCSLISVALMDRLEKYIEKNHIFLLWTLPKRFQCYWLPPWEAVILGQRHRKVLMCLGSADLPWVEWSNSCPKLCANICSFTVHSLLYSALIQQIFVVVTKGFCAFWI